MSFIRIKKKNILKFPNILFEIEQSCTSNLISLKTSSSYMFKLNVNTWCKYFQENSIVPKLITQRKKNVKTFTLKNILKIFINFTTVCQKPLNL